jgi:hypothetical protein
MNKLAMPWALGFGLVNFAHVGIAQTYFYRLRAITKEFPSAINNSGHVTGNGEPCPECDDNEAFL